MCNHEIIIFTAVSARRGRSTATSPTTAPLLAAGAVLSGDGVDPETPIGATHVGTENVPLKSTVSAAAGLTVAEDGRGPGFVPQNVSDAVSIDRPCVPREAPPSQLDKDETAGALHHTGGSQEAPRLRHWPQKTARARGWPTRSAPASGGQLPQGRRRHVLASRPGSDLLARFNRSECGRDPHQQTRHRLDRRRHAVERIITAIKAGATLQLHYGRRRWWGLSNGPLVSAGVALIVINHPDVVSIGDSLPETPTQTWRFVEPEGLR